MQVEMAEDTAERKRRELARRKCVRIRWKEHVRPEEIKEREERVPRDKKQELRL